MIYYYRYIIYYIYIYRSYKIEIIRRMVSWSRLPEPWNAKTRWSAGFAGFLRLVCWFAPNIDPLTPQICIEFWPTYNPSLRNNLQGYWLSSGGCFTTRNGLIAHWDIGHQPRRHYYLITKYPCRKKLLKGLFRILCHTSATREAARSDVFNYMEMFYSTRRRHGFNNQLSPVEYEAQYQKRLVSV